MTVGVKAELHDIVDRLGEERAADVLEYARLLLDEDSAAGAETGSTAGQRMRPRTIPGKLFRSQPPQSAVTLAEQQDVPPVTKFEDLLGDFWPEDETADEFIAAVRQWRREGGYT